MKRFFQLYPILSLFLVLSGVPFFRAFAEDTQKISSNSDNSLSVKEKGLWLVAEKDGIFRIDFCTNKHDRLCGWLVGMDYTDAEPEKDVWGHSQCGLQIISDMRPLKNGRWSGHILDPRSGRTYNSQLWVTKSNQLKLLGYIGIPLFGQVQTWDHYQGSPLIGANCRMKQSHVSSRH